MESFALGLFYLSLLSIVIVVGLIIYSLLKKDFKLKPKKLFLILLGCIVFFVDTLIFYGSVESPETKARIEANQKTKEEEKAKEEQKVQEETIQENTETDIKTDEENEVEVDVNKEEEPKVDNRFTLTTEPNTSAAVDELIKRGKVDAQAGKEDNLKEAVKFINDNYNNYWADNETMHRTMYYGALLQYAKHDKVTEELGLDAVQVVKYIYRKIEKIEDQPTQSNLKQIQKSLNNIPNDWK